MRRHFFKFLGHLCSFFSALHPFRFTFPEKTEGEKKASLVASYLKNELKVGYNKKEYLHHVGLRYFKIVKISERTVSKVVFSHLFPKSMSVVSVKYVQLVFRVCSPFVAGSLD